MLISSTSALYKGLLLIICYISPLFSFVIVRILSLFSFAASRSSLVLLHSSLLLLHSFLVLLRYSSFLPTSPSFFPTSPLCFPHSSLVPPYSSLVPFLFISCFPLLSPYPSSILFICIHG